MRSGSLFLSGCGFLLKTTSEERKLLSESGIAKIIP